MPRLTAGLGGVKASCLDPRDDAKNSESRESLSNILSRTLHFGRIAGWKYGQFLNGPLHFEVGPAEDVHSQALSLLSLLLSFFMLIR